MHGMKAKQSSAASKNMIQTVKIHTFWLKLAMGEYF